MYPSPLSSGQDTTDSEVEVGEVEPVEGDPNKPDTDVGNAVFDNLWLEESVICPTIIELDARFEVPWPATELVVEGTDGEPRLPVSRSEVFTDDAERVIVVVSAVVRTVT